MQSTQYSQGILKGGSITVPLTSCLTGLYQSVLQIKTKNFSCHTADSKPVKQEVNSTVILSPLVFLGTDYFARAVSYNRKMFMKSTAELDVRGPSLQDLLLRVKF